MADLVGLAGDWHGNTRWAQESIRALVQAGASHIYHLGDFGIWPGENGRRYIQHLDAAAKHWGVDIWVTPGNHDDYDQIADLNADEGGLLWLTPRIAVLPRGFRWAHKGRTFVSLGGAPSIDFEQRTEGVSWWRAETITEPEAIATARAGFAEVMLAHDSPDGGTEAVQAIIDTPADKSPWSAAGLAYANQGRMAMNIAVDGVHPLVFAHGHYHVADDTQRDGTRFLALAGDGMDRNVALLRLDDLAVSWDGTTWTTTPDPTRRTK